MTTTRTMAILCPGWCQQDQEHDPYINADGPDRGGPPRTGLRQRRLLDRSAAGRRRDADCDLPELEKYDAKPPELRELAQSILLAAAAWLEAQS